MVVPDFQANKVRLVAYLDPLLIVKDVFENAFAVAIGKISRAPDVLRRVTWVSRRIVRASVLTAVFVVA